MTTMEKVAGRTNDAPGLALSLWNIGRREFQRVSLTQAPGEATFRLYAGDLHLLDGECTIRFLSKTSVIPDGVSEKHGVTVFTGRRTDSEGGTALIVVNCGQEPPTLQISLAVGRSGTRSASWQITHDVQEEILAVLSER